jgi:hydroxymethylbilane synthase
MKGLWKMKIRVGARGSKLSLAQVQIVINALKAKRPDLTFEIVTLKTKGDLILHKSLSEIGGKGLFVDEFETALKNHEIDVAIHSGKDLPALTSNDFDFSVMKRGAVNDVLLKRTKDVHIIGTSSPRRTVLLKHFMKEAEVKLLRGNINTRIEKLKAGNYDAIILAAAGLERLHPDVSGLEIVPLDPYTFIPASCQGILAIEYLKESPMKDIFSCIHDEETNEAFLMERKVMQKLNASCHDAIGAYSPIEKGERMIYSFYHDSPIYKEKAADLSVLIEELKEHADGK